MLTLTDAFCPVEDHQTHVAVGSDPTAMTFAFADTGGAVRLRAVPAYFVALTIDGVLVVPLICHWHWGAGTVDPPTVSFPLFPTGAVAELKSTDEKIMRSPNRPTAIAPEAKNLDFSKFLICTTSSPSRF